MGPKKKGGGKGNKKSKEKKNEFPKPKKSQYLERIAELNAILAQVRKETFETEGVYFATDKKYEQVQEDIADVISYLEHEIKDCEDEIEMYNLGIEEHSNEIRNQNNYYNKILAKMDEELEIKKIKINEKMESATAKLSSFEEIRRHREEYLNRKAILEGLLKEMEQRHKEEIYEAEKRAIINQDRQQKEMEKRLSALCADFREATDVRIGETTNSIIKENIKLGNMLTCQQELFAKMRATYEKTKNIQRYKIFDLQLKQDEYKLAHEKYAASAGKIEAIIFSVDELTRKIEYLKKLIKINRRLKRKIAELECYYKDINEELLALTRSLDEVEDQTANAKGNLHYFQSVILKLQQFLYQTAKMVKAAIDCENIPLKEAEEMLVEPDAETIKSEKEDEEKEIMYKQRETLTEQIVTQMQSEIANEEDVHLSVPSLESYESNISYRSSLDIVLSSKRIIYLRRRVTLYWCCSNRGV
ncbi:UNVERIFIED_CONTAM: hypothetical protein PYX00_005080 [Menopon gallinae]|uniref:Cilia- and flagella-associated protein 157 n=1 Tax=Menopon gallinae TaxID=328185 RepID=A0AAW2HPV5_9NEOP